MSTPKTAPRPARPAPARQVVIYAPPQVWELLFPALDDAARQWGYRVRGLGSGRVAVVEAK